MSSYQGIQETKADILTGKKIEKVRFEDRIEPAQADDLVSDNQKVKTISAKEDKTVRRLNDKNLKRRKENKNQVTAYLLDDELEMLEEMHYLRRKNKIKTDKSTIIGEAIKVFYKKTNS